MLVNREKEKRQKYLCPMKVIKVVYIAGPMKVKTSASKFRDLVQELTGQDSDTARYMEVNGGDNQGSFTFLTNNWGLILIMGCLISCPCQIPVVSFCLTFRVLFQAI